MTEDEVPIDDMPQARGAARAFSSGCGAARLGAAWQEILRTGLGLADGVDPGSMESSCRIPGHSGDLAA
ncbi:hypothetical protein E4N62_38900 [Streptomyces sp. MNU76]|uniref:hypothetical protein n=1 Tax=Streptomyces sp. MNU76 TaxID=2560026 RepID=UPI001E45DAC1|nr:hypothetical protein [Streptomyces sp. MNU76]MCC9710688.1 hypothetical protein [Streptomyces sp. MNU76]